MPAIAAVIRPRQARRAAMTALAASTTARKPNSAQGLGAVEATRTGVA